MIGHILLWICSFFTGGAGVALLAKFKGVRERERALENGLQCLLRAELISLHEKYTEKGYCPVYAKEAARRCYESYHALGGNGVITKLYADVMALPEKQMSQKNENVL